jgi:hypothetical protein
MTTEHLQNVRPSWVSFGWFVSAAATALVLFALIGLGLLPSDPAAGDAGWTVLAVAVGFFVGGWFTGARAGAAPILHAVAIGLFSLVVWFLVNALLGSWAGAAEWRALPPTLTAGLLLLQIAVAALGAHVGSREARAEAAAAARAAHSEGVRPPRSRTHKRR